MAQTPAPVTGGTRRQQTTVFVVLGFIVLAAIGTGILYFIPNSPLRPQASTIAGDTTVFTTPKAAEFRDGQVGEIAGDKVTVDEPNGGSFSFKLNDQVIIRGLNDKNTFEVVGKDKLHTGDIVSVFYQQTDTAQRIARIDIIRAK